MLNVQVHRIGRTGRSGKTGIATTFINKNQSESILLDLKHLLKEAKQRIPPVLLALHDPMDALEALEAASGKRVRAVTFDITPHVMFEAPSAVASVSSELHRMVCMKLHLLTCADLHS